MRKAITLALTFFVIVTCLPVVALAQESNGQFANNPCAIDMDQFWDGAKITKKRTILSLLKTQMFLEVDLRTVELIQTMFLPHYLLLRQTILVAKK